jgi:hypothetical protein
MESTRVFLVETYQSKADKDGALAIAERAALAACKLRHAGMPVRYVQSIFIPADETCFHIFEAPSETDAGKAASRAGIHVERVLEMKTFRPCTTG